MMPLSHIVALVQIPAASFLIQLPGNAPGKHIEADLRAWTQLTHMKKQMEFLCPALAIAATWMEFLYFFLSVILSLHKRINIKNFFFSVSVSRT